MGTYRSQIRRLKNTDGIILTDRSGRYGALGARYHRYVSAGAGSPEHRRRRVNWKFTPNTITLHTGETTTLRFTSSGGVHGVKSDELGIPLTTITPGNFVTVDVTPKKAGTYVLPCQIMCGAGHADMKLTVVVQ